MRYFSVGGLFGWKCVPHYELSPNLGPILSVFSSACSPALFNKLALGREKVNSSTWGLLRLGLISVERWDVNKINK